MKNFPDNHFNMIVTDPPYGLKFMGKKWDYQIPSVEYWKELLRICKPGTMALIFGGSRTYHRLTCAVEDAGWEIRDCIMWIYGSGFPKSHNHFGLEGYGTALKPAHEPIIVAMKPLEGTFKQNVEKWGVAGLNIDDSRIGIARSVPASISKNKNDNCFGDFGSGSLEELNPNKGRWPANIIFDEEAGQILDEQTDILKSGSGNRRPNGGGDMFNGFSSMNAEFSSSCGGASRFFYCAKASPSERNRGLERMILGQSTGGGGINHPNASAYGSIKAKAQNFHPTVKPIALMKYLLKLIAPPKESLCLDPFCGSGSTLVAAKELKLNCVGLELNEEYCEIARNRFKS